MSFVHGPFHEVEPKQDIRDIQDIQQNKIDVDLFQSTKKFTSIFILLPNVSYVSYVLYVLYVSYVLSGALYNDDRAWIYTIVGFFGNLVCFVLFFDRPKVRVRSLSMSG